MSTAILTKPEFDVTRAWKDEFFYEDLSAEEKALMPEHPAGEFLPEIDLQRPLSAPMNCIVGTASEYCSIYNTYYKICG